MSDGKDLVGLVEELPERARGRACILLTHDYVGQKQWAEQLAGQTNSGQLDLLDLFAGNAQLAGNVQEFTVARLFEHLAGYGEKPVLIISGLEFLKATWSGLPSASEEFASRVETWRGTPALLFVMQYDKALETRNFTRYPQYAFVIDQRETIKL